MAKKKEKKFWKLLKKDTRIKPYSITADFESFVEGLHSEEDYWLKGYKRWQKTNQKQNVRIQK
jgi:hypothetical protein